MRTVNGRRDDFVAVKRNHTELRRQATGILLALLQLPFFLWRELGLLLVFLLAFVFSSFVAHNDSFQ